MCTLYTHYTSLLVIYSPYIHTYTHNIHAPYTYTLQGGGSLEDVLYPKKGSTKTRPPLTLHDKIYILKGIAHGLSELHSVGVVHADIKV